MRKLSSIVFLALLLTAPYAHSEERPKTFHPTEAKVISPTDSFHTSYSKMYDFMKDVNHLSVEVGRAGGNWKYPEIANFKLPKEEDIRKKISDSIGRKFLLEKMDINAVPEPASVFDKRDLETSALLYVEISYRPYENATDSSTLVGVMAPSTKRLNPDKDGRAKYLMLPATPRIFFINSNAQQNDGSLDAAIESLTDALITQIKHKH